MWLDDYYHYYIYYLAHLRSACSDAANDHRQQLRHADAEDVFSNLLKTVFKVLMLTSNWVSVSWVLIFESHRAPLQNAAGASVSFVPLPTVTASILSTCSSM